MKKRGRGRPAECRACDGGMKHDACMSKDVVYSLKCAVFQEEYVGETERTALKRTEEHHRRARNATFEKPFGDHYRRKRHTFSAHSPFCSAQILAGRQRSYVDRGLFISGSARQRLTVTMDGGGMVMCRLINDTKFNVL